MASQRNQNVSKCQADRRSVDRRDLEATNMTVLKDEMEPCSSTAAFVPAAVVTGVAALSIAALLLPGEAHAAEVLPLDLFSQFLVRNQNPFEDPATLQRSSSYVYHTCSFTIQARVCLHCI